MDAGVVPRVHDDTRVRRFRGHLLVAGSGDSLELSESAEFIFRRIDGKRSVDEISAMLAAEYGIPLSTARHDTMELIEELSAQRITMVG